MANFDNEDLGEVYTAKDKLDTFSSKSDIVILFTRNAQTYDEQM